MMNRILGRRREFLRGASPTRRNDLRAKARRKSTAHRWRPLRIEHLEDRSLLTSVSWDGGGTTSNWTDRFNWVGDTVPGTTDTAVIDQTGTFTVTLDANVSVAGLQLGNVITGTQTLDASSHTLTVSGAAQVFAHGSLFFSNTQFFGNLTNGGILNVSLGSVSGTILNQTTGLINIGSFGFCGGTGQLTAANGLTNDGQILLRSTFECGSSGGGILTVTSGTLLNDAGATILSTGPAAPAPASRRRSTTAARSRRISR